MVNSLLSLAKKEVSASKQVSKPGQVKRAPVDPLAEFARKYNEGGNRPATPLPKPTAATKVPVSQRLTPEGMKARTEELYGPNPGERDKSKTVFSKRRRDVGDALFGLDFLRSNMDPEEFEQVKGVAGSYIMSRIGGYKKGDARTRPQDKAQVDPLLAAQEFLQLSARGDQKTIFDSINRFKKTRASQAKQNELAGALREEDRYKQVISNPFSNYYLTEGQKRDMAAAPGGDIRGVDLTSAGFTAAGEIVRNNVNDAARVNAARAWLERMRKDPSEKTLAEGLAMFGAEAYAFLGDQVGGLAGMVPDVGGDIVNLVSPTTPGMDRAGAGINTTLKALGILGGGAVVGRAGMEAGAALRAGNKLGAAKAVGRGVGELVSPIPLGGEAPVARPVEAPMPKPGPAVGSKAPQFKVSKQNPWLKPEKPVAVPSPAEARAELKAKLEAIKGAKVPKAAEAPSKPVEMVRDEWTGREEPKAAPSGNALVSHNSGQAYYHGHRDEIGTLSEADIVGGSWSKNLFGDGLYLTDDPSVAAKYAKKGTTRGYISGSPRLLDMSQPVPEDVANAWGIDWNPKDQSWRRWSAGDAWKEAEVNLRDNDGYTNVQEARGELSARLKSLGYDGITHKANPRGGWRNDGNGATNNVTILFNPEKHLGIKPVKGTNPQRDIPKSAVKEATASEKGKQTRKGIEEGKQEGLLKPDAGAAPVAPVSKARVVTMEIDGVKRTATLTPEQSAKWDAEVATHEQRVKHYKDQQRRLNRNGSIDTSDAANLKAEGMRHAASKRKIAGLLTATERAAQDEFNSKIRAGDTVILKDGRVGEVVQNPAFGMTKVKVGGTVERVEHVSLTKTEPPKATNAKPPATPAPVSIGVRTFDLMRDGIEGKEIPWDNVESGSPNFQYALGSVERGDKPSVFRRRANEEGTYGGWRWETSKPIEPKPDAAPAPVSKDVAGAVKGGEPVKQANYRGLSDDEVIAAVKEVPIPERASHPAFAEYQRRDLHNLGRRRAAQFAEEQAVLAKERKAKTNKGKTLQEMGQAARADKSLDNTQIRVADGSVVTLRERVDRDLASGSVPEVRKTPKYLSGNWYKRESKLRETIWKLGSRSGFNPSDDVEIAKLKKELEAGNPKIDKYVMAGPDGSYSVITKAEYDYAVSKQAAEAATPAPKDAGAAPVAPVSKEVASKPVESGGPSRTLKDLMDEYETAPGHRMRDLEIEIEKLASPEDVIEAIRTPKGKRSKSQEVLASSEGYGKNPLKRAPGIKYDRIAEGQVGGETWWTDTHIALKGKAPKPTTEGFNPDINRVVPKDYPEAPLEIAGTRVLVDAHSNPIAQTIFKTPSGEYVAVNQAYVDIVKKSHGENVTFHASSPTRPVVVRDGDKVIGVIGVMDPRGINSGRMSGLVDTSAPKPVEIPKPTATPAPEKLRGKALRDASLDRLAELKAKPNKPMKGGKQAGSINIDPEVFNIYVDIAKSYVDEGVDWTKAILDDLKDEVAPHVVAIKRELVRRGVLEGEKPTQSIGAPSGEEKVRLLSASPDDPRLDPFDDAFDEKFAGRVAEALGADSADDVARALRDHQQKVQETITTRELEGESAKRASQALRDLAQSGRAPKAAYVWRRDARRKGYQWFLDKKQPVALVDLSTLPDDIRNAVVDKIASGAYDEELKYVVGDKADSFPERFYSNPKGTLRPSEIVTEEVGGTRGTGIGEDRFYAPRHLVEKIAQEYGAVARKGAGDVATKVIADVTGATKKEAGMWNKRPTKPKVKGRTTAVSQAGTGREVNPGTSAEGWQERGTKAYLDGRVDIEARTREVLDGGRMMDPEEIAGAKAFLVDVEAKMKAIRNANPNTYAGRADYQRLEKFFDDVPEAVGKSGSYASELFRSLQGYAKDDYSFENLWKDVRAANAGAGKNEKLRAEFEGMARQIEDLESKLKKQVAEYNANKRMARAGAPVNSRTYGASNKVVTKDTYSAALERIKARANALQEGGTVSASSIMDPELLKDMAIWAGYHVEAGVRTLADLATKAKEDGVDATTEELAEAVRVHLDEQDALRAKRTKTGPTKADLRKEVARPGVPDPASPKFQKGQEFGVDVLIDDATGSGIKDPEIGRTRVQLLRAKSEARKMVEEERMMADYRGKNLLGKAWVQVRDVNNMARTFLTVFDNSIPGRQGFYTLVSDPKTWGKGFMRSWKGFTPKGLENVLVETEAFPRFNQAIKDGHLKLGAFNHVPEEDFLGSKKLQKLPGVKQSEGMADAFTNYTRMARYQKLSDLFEVSIGRELSPEQRKLIAGFVNSETGAGHVPAQVKGLSELMFSARFASSRIENMLMADVWRANKMKDKELAKFFALQYVKRKIAMTAIVGVVAGAEQLTGKNTTDMDPRSAEGFGKLREGKFTYDLTAGSSQYESLVWRLVSKSLGKGGVGMDAPKQNPNMRPMDVAARLSSGRGATDRGQDGIDYASDFFINKLSPAPRAVAGHFLSPEWKKKNFKDGESYARHVAKSNLPISVQNAMDQNSNNVPAPRIMANWIIDALGISVGGEATRDASTNRGK